MINLNELRLGNTVHEGIVAEVLLDELLVHEPDSGREVYCSSFAIQPISLTDEILVKRYGFAQKEDPAGSYFYVPGLALINESSGWRIYSKSMRVPRPVFYQHELENLYFALCGREINRPVLSGQKGKRGDAAPIMNSLRLGNLVNGKSVSGFKDQVIQVKSLTKRGVIYNEFRAVHTGRGIEIVQELDFNDPMLSTWTTALPIDKEWLIKLGFEPRKNVPEIYHRGKFTLYLHGATALLNEGTQDFGGPIESIHQLQNLWYALTGEDLEIQSAR